MTTPFSLFFVSNGELLLLRYPGILLVVSRVSSLLERDSSRELRVPFFIGVGKSRRLVTIFFLRRQRRLSSASRVRLLVMEAFSVGIQGLSSTAAGGFFLLVIGAIFGGNGSLLSGERRDISVKNGGYVCARRRVYAQGTGENFAGNG